MQGDGAGDSFWLAEALCPACALQPGRQKEGTAGYEISFNFNGVACSLTPRAPSEIKTKSKVQLLSVNEAEQQRNPCGRLVVKKGARWELTSHGTELIGLLLY